MSYNSSAAGPMRARTNCAMLAELGVPLPKPVSAALDVLDGISTPAEPAPGAMATAVLAGAADAELQRLALAELTFPAVRDAYGKATIAAADGVAEAIRSCSNEIHAALAKLAAKAIDKLKAAAAIDVSLEHLVRAGRHADAEKVAVADVTAASLDKLYRTRDKLLWPRGRYPSETVERWTDPWLSGDGFIEGIRKGGTLWFPSFTEACEHANSLQASQRAEEAAVLADA